MKVDTLPIYVTEKERSNPYLISSLAQRAFSLARYDFAPENAVEAALEARLIVLIEEKADDEDAEISE